MSLQSLDKTHERFFKVYNDADLGLDFSKFETQNKKIIVESQQDDDIETDSDVLDNGV